LDLKFDPAYTLRAGKFTAPVGLERLQSSSALTFVERGLPSEIAPNRELGVQLQGDLFNSTVSYALGYFNGSTDGRDEAATDVDNRKEVGARLWTEPFKNDPGLLQGLGFGVGGTVGPKLQGNANSTNANNFLPRYRSPGQAQVFAYRSTASTATASAAGTTGVYADGDVVRISPQASYYRNSFGLLGEYITSKQDLAITNTPAGPGTPVSFAEKLENKSWQAVATYVLTGEDASYRGVAKPDKPYTVGGPGWGALELTARYGELEIDKDAFPTFANPTTSVSKIESWTLGLNWYLTSNVKTALNYTNTSFEGGGGGTNAAPIDREDEKTVFARLQLSF
ncbi:MAG TPA: porin, partial [Vineibacter sp.]|nr:porin [Vineibacter sp.]